MTRQATASPAETYENHLGPALFQPCARLLMAEATPQPGERAVDVACGTGIATRQLAAALGPQGQITAVDFGPGMLAVAHARAPTDGAPIAWRESTADHLPIEDHSVDLLVCQQGFQFFPDRLSAAREMRRVLTDEGRAVLAVWGSLDKHAVFRALMEAESKYLGVPVDTLAVPFSCGDPHELHAVLMEAGFRHVHIKEQSFTAELPDPETFYEQIILAGAAVIPELDEEKDPAQRAELVRAVKQAAEHTVTQYQEGDLMRFPMHTYLAVAEV